MVGLEQPEGISFDALMRGLPLRRSADDFRFVGSLIAAACEALHQGHELTGPDGKPLGVVHAALSPRNLLVTPTGGIKLLDFGADLDPEPRAGSVRENSGYLAPEQVRGHAVDRRTDVFGLGVVLFELATGRPPFDRPNELLTFKAILDEPVPQPALLQPDVTPALSGVIMRALARDPAERFPTALAFGEAVLDAIAPLGGPLDRAEAYERARTLIAPPPPVFSETAPTVPTVAAATTPPVLPQVAPPPRERSRRHQIFVGAIVASGLLAVGTLFVVRARPAPSALAPARDSGARSNAQPATTAPVPPPAPSATASARTGRPLRRAPGYVTIDSRPGATIYVDGKKLGETPLVRAAVPAGRHKVRAVLANGREKRFAVTVRPGRALPPRKLKW